MSAERLEEENARLIRRERLDLVPTKVLGLFVVGTLARRWEVGVVLTRTPGGGVTAEVTIPSSLLLTMSPVTVASGGSSAGTAAESRTAPAAVVGAAASAATTRSASDSGSYSASASAGVQGAGATAARAEAAAGVTGGAGSGQGAPASAGTGAAGAGSAASERSLTAATDQPTALPRRIPHRGSSATGPGTAPAASSDAPSSPELPSRAATFIPQARAGETAPAEVTGNGDGARPLRRRVRGATLRTTLGADPVSQAAPPRPADAEAVRDALDEFEAAVERAHRDIETGSHTRPVFADDVETHRTASDPPHDQNHSPEGAEQ
ncbi:MAG: hypothetical protein JF598_02990 [Streptomyces sp.]|nr:hypothetical protein [Streptomyces sp.]